MTMKESQLDTGLMALWAMATCRIYSFHRGLIFYVFLYVFNNAVTDRQRLTV